MTVSRIARPTDGLRQRQRAQLNRHITLERNAWVRWWIGQKVMRGAVFHDHPVVHKHPWSTTSRAKTDLMRDDHHRYVLVERHQFRVRGQGDGDAPLLATGQLSRVGLGLRSQTDLVQQVSRVSMDQGGGLAAKLSRRSGFEDFWR